MYQATAAAFIPLPSMEITLAPKTKRSAFFWKIDRTFQFKRLPESRPAGARQNALASVRNRSYDSARSLEVAMKHHQRCVLAVAVLQAFCFLGHAQVDKIEIPAGTPEDQALTAITNEQDEQKRLVMYQDFVQKFAANPAAVAYGDWQISQAFQAAGDLQKAMGYGDKALAGSPHNLDIIVSQANIAQQMKNSAKVMQYAVLGGVVFNSIAKQPKPEGVTDQEFATHIDEEKKASQSYYEFLEAASYNSIAEQTSA